MSLKQRLDDLARKIGVRSTGPLAWLTVEVFEDDDEQEQIRQAEERWLAEHDELPRGNAKFQYVVVHLGGLNRDGSNTTAIEPA